MVELSLLIPRVPGSNLLAAKKNFMGGNAKGEGQCQRGGAIPMGGVGGCFWVVFGLVLGSLGALLIWLQNSNLLKLWKF